MSDNKLFLLDAYALIYRAYYAFIRAPRVNSKGLNTSAIFGFVNTLDDVLKREDPSHIAVVFDPSGPTFRHEMFAPYKAHREATPEDIKSAVPYIKQIIEAYNIPVLEVSGYEADDVIGTLAKQAEKAGYDVFMMTPDKDYAQLVSDKVKMYKPARNGNGAEILGVDEVKEKFGIEYPEQVIDILALMGDSADNIPGCPGVGEKTAAKLIAAYGSVDGLYQNVDQLKGKQKEKVIENKAQVELSRVLATIKIDVPIEFSETSVLRKPINIQALILLFDELEFRTMKQKYMENSQSSAPQSVQRTLFDQFDDQEEVQPSPTLSYSTIETREHNYYLVNSDMAIASLCAELSVQKEFCVDTETTGLDACAAELVGLAFSFKEAEAYYVPVPANQSEAQKLVNRFKLVLEDPQILKIGQNIKYDMLVLNNYGITLGGPVFDTMIAHYIIQPEQKHNLDFLAEYYLGYQNITTEALIGKKGASQLSMRHVEHDLLTKYAGEDADITFCLKQILEKEIRKEGLEDLLYKMEMPLLKVLFDMERTGISLDVEALKLYSVDLTQQIIQLEDEIKKMAGCDFNVSSPKQVGEILFDRMKIDDKAKKTKSGQYSTAEEALQKLEAKHPIVGKILEYRGLKKLLNTYVDTLPTLINKRTGKIHTSFNQAVAATGRLSSNNPNLQNIPIRDQAGREIRKTFVASDDKHLFVSADYSQVELRLMAHMSKDKNMLEAFVQGEDIHTATAAKINGISIDEVTPDSRRKAKTANFGIIYGISAFGLAERLNISRSEGKDLIEGYFNSYPGVKAFMDECIAAAREKGYVATLFGRKRFLADINSRNGIVRGVAERNAINAPIQGSAADIIKMAMINIHKAFTDNNLKSKMILQVHDELNFDVLREELDQVIDIVTYEMEHAISLDLPLTIEIGKGNNWLEAH